MILRYDSHPLMVAVVLGRQSEFRPTVSHQECSACGRMHPANCFHTRNASPSGISVNCKACMSFMTRNWQERMQRMRESNAPVTDKTCGSCNKRLPIDLFAKYFNSRDGFSGSCRACSKQTHDVWVQERKQHFNLHPRLTVHGKELTCNSCKTVKAVSEYNKTSDSSTGLRYYCKDCMNKYASARYHAAKKWQV